MYKLVINDTVMEFQDISDFEKFVKNRNKSILSILRGKFLVDFD